jgi:HIRAN domain
MILKSEIRGTTYYPGAAEALHQYVHRDDAVRLERDPNNKFSRHAIGVWWASQFLGFVRDSDAKRVAPLIDSHHDVTAIYKGNSVIEIHTPIDC